MSNYDLNIITIGETNFNRKRVHFRVATIKFSKFTKKLRESEYDKKYSRPLISAKEIKEWELGSTAEKWTYLKAIKGKCEGERILSIKEVRKL